VEGPRAYERANDVILSNIDLLVVVWDGARARGRAGTGDVVQSAVSLDIPVIVLDPKGANPAQLLSGEHEVFDRTVATDLERKPLASDLTALIDRILLPPPGRAARRGLEDFNNEGSRLSRIRFEYSMLLKLFRASKVRSRPSDSQKKNDSEGSTQVRMAPPQPSLLGRYVDRTDDLANYYARLYRSSATSGYLIIIFIALLSAMIGLLYPPLSNISIVVQMAVNALVLIDTTIRKKHRWLERWLDYRSIAERLRSLRFLQPLGMAATSHGTHARWGRKPSWVDWYIRRCQRGLGAPNVTIGNTELAEAAWRLVNIEVKEQLEYHRRTFRQLGALEARLSTAAGVALILTITVAAGLWITAFFVGGIQNVEWKPLALVALAIFPAATTAFKGIRADADLVRLVERSAQATAVLTRLKRAIATGAIEYDRVAAAASRVASMMGDELSEWRSVLETRRARQSRRMLGRRRRFPRRTG
jgi:hypothetical protein